MDALPEGIVEQLLLWLPYVAVVSARQVCREWKRLIDSQSFARSYRSTVKLVTKFCRTEFPATTYELVDSSGSVLRCAEEVAALGSITFHINGLVLKQYMNGNCYIGNIFSNNWEQILNPPLDFCIDDTAVFDLGAGQYRLVYWIYGRVEETIMTLEPGQTEWSITRSDQETWWYTNPVVIGSSIFRVHYVDGVLVEYDSALGKASSKRVTAEEEKAFLDFERDSCTVELLVWQGRLYFVILDNNRQPQTLEIWQISTSDGRAALVSKSEMEQWIDWFKVKEVEDGGVIHFQGTLPDDPGTAVSVVYNMSGKSVQATSVSSSHVMCTKLVQMPVKLSA